MAKRRQFKEELYEICKERNLEIVDLNNGYNAYSTFKCKTCNKVFDTKPVYIFEKDRSCPRCKPDWHPRRITTEYYRDDVKYYFGDRYTILGEYEGNNKKPILTRCNICNTEWKIRLNDLLSNGHGCPTCGKIKNKLAVVKGYKEYNKEIECLTNGEYSVINYDINNGYTIRHNNCSYEWNEDRIYGVRKRLENGNEPCPQCDDYITKYTKESISEKLNELTNDEYEVQDDFVNSTSICTIKHLKCGNLFRAHIGNILYRAKHDVSTRFCPCSKIISRSAAEDHIIEYIKTFYNGDIILNSRTIISPYELDIYLPEANIAIEYNGLYWHSKLTNPDIKSDLHQFKSLLCHEKNIRLIQIFDNEWKINKEFIKLQIKSIIENPQLSFRGKNLKWGIPTNIKNVKLSEAEKVYLFHSRICNKEESNNYTYSTGNYIIED